MVIFIVILFAMVAIISLFPVDNENKRRNLYVFIGFILTALVAFRDGDSVADYNTYLSMYHMITDGVDILTDPAFVLIAKFVYILGNPIFLFIIYAIIGVSLKLIAIRNLTELWFLSLVIYISNSFILHEMIQIRTGVAAGLLLLCIQPIYERNWKRFLLFSVIAFLFHASALIILPLWFIGYKKPRKLLLAVSIPIAYLIYFSKINLIGTIPIPIIEEKIMIYQELQEQEIGSFADINVFNLVFLAKILIFYLLLWKYDIIRQHNKYAVIFMKIFCVSLISFPIFAVMPIMGFRISELFSVVEIVLLPMLYYIFKPRIVSRLLIVLVGFAVLSILVFYNKLII